MTNPKYMLAVSALLMILWCDSMTDSRAADLNSIQSSAKNETSSVVRLNSPDDALGPVSGCYRLPGFALSGYALYLFPDGSAFVSEFSDISSETLVAAGRWKFSERLVHIVWQKWEITNQGDRARFPKKDFEALALYMRMRENNAIKLLTAESKIPSADNCLIKVADYYDWENIKRRIAR